VYELLHEAKPVLLNFGEPGAFDGTPFVVDASTGDEWELPVLGPVNAPTAVLIRPDGYLAWVGEGSHAGLSEALTAWFGVRQSAPDNQTAPGRDA
jgi:3-(3-hydroxy-phenyl)propionate hydroxylase